MGRFRVFKPAKAGGLVDGILLFRHGRHHIVTLPAIDNLPVRHREPEKLFDLSVIVESAVRKKLLGKQ